MGPVQRDHVIQHLPADALDPSLGDAVLPGAPNPGPNDFQSAVLQKGVGVAAEFAVVVEHVRIGRGREVETPPCS